MKYESDILYDLMKRDGLLNPSQNNLPYESELKEKYVDEVKGAYPKLIDYQAEWLNYAYHNPIGEFPYVTITDVTNATVENVVPYAYKSAILKGNTGYHDIDTGEFLEAFEEGRNLELVSVQMPVLKATGKNLFDGHLELGNIEASNGTNVDSSTRKRSVNYIPVNGNTTYCVSNDKSCEVAILTYDKNKNYINSLGVATRFTTTADCKFIRIAVVTVEEVKVQIEQGSIATSYEPFKSNILTVNEDVALRGIGDVKDTLDLMTGEVVECIGEIVLDGSEIWNYHGNLSTDTLAVFSVYNDFGCLEWLGAGSILCDKFPITQKRTTDSNAQEGIYDKDGWAGKNKIPLIINKDRLSSVSVDGLKLWLSNNQLKLQFKLQNKSIKTVDLSNVNQDGVETTFRPFEGTMHVKTDGEPLKPLLDMEIPVEATTQNLDSFVNLEGVERTVNENEEIVGDENNEQLL